MTYTETSIIPKKLFHNMANGYALATSALLAIFCASLCNLPPHNGFLNHYYHGAQSGEIVFRPPVFSEQMSMLECSLLFKVSLEAFKYFSKASCAFNPAVYMILCSGDVETNPGYVPECSTRPQRQGHTSWLKEFYTNARSIVNKVAKLQLELANSKAGIVVLTETHLDCSFQVRRSSAAIILSTGNTVPATELDMMVVF